MQRSWTVSPPTTSCSEVAIARFVHTRSLICDSYALSMSVRMSEICLQRCDIIATYIRSHTEHDPSADGGRRVVTMFDYFDKHRLREFLDAPPKSRHNNGILQRFVEGAGECNTVLRCTWTPRHVEISRRRSSRPLAKGFVKRLSAHHRRLATFEGPPVLSVNLPMSGAFPRRVIIEKTEAIVRHIQQIGRRSSELSIH
eukprot:SAG11_NODE_354_length_10336_cov_3.789391_6_plen_199_part_00